jgi:mono/diheme cytochrome c family protein
MMKPVSFPGALKTGFAGLAAALLLSAGPPPTSNERQFLDRYCATCHSERSKSGGLSLVQADLSKLGAQPELWEKVVRKVRTRLMPPPNTPQPSEADRLAILTWLETSLDAASAAKLNPGRTETLRRLNRTEYQNAIRDLLALDIDAASLLPADESGHGFDNVNVGDLSATLLNRYISAAQKISRLAVGSTQSSLLNDTIRLPADLTQEDQLPGLPLGTRGGVSTSYTFAQDGEYEIQISLMRDLAGVVSGLREAGPARDAGAARPGAVPTFTGLERQPSATKTLNEKDFESAHCRGRQGPHNSRSHSSREGSSLIDTPRQPTESRFKRPRASGVRRPAIDQISVTGTLCAKRRAGYAEPPSIVCMPANRTRQNAQEEKWAARDSDRR